MGCGGSRVKEEEEKAKIAAEQKRVAEKAAAEEQLNKFKALRTKFNKLLEDNPGFKLNKEEEISEMWNDGEEMLKKEQWTKEQFTEACYYYLCETLVETGDLDLSHFIPEVLKEITDKIEVEIEERDMNQIKMLYTQGDVKGKFFEVSEGTKNIALHLMNLFKHDPLYDVPIMGFKFDIKSPEIMKLLAEVIPKLKNLETILFVIEISGSPNIDDFAPFLNALYSSSTLKHLAFGSKTQDLILKSSDTVQKIIANLPKHPSLLSFALGNVLFTDENFKMFMTNVNTSTTLKAFGVNGSYKPEEIQPFFDALKTSKSLIGAALFGIEDHESVQDKVNSTKSANPNLKMVIAGPSFSR